MDLRKLLTVGLALLVMTAAPVHAAVRVFACEPEWAALAREIGGDAVQTTSATTALQDPHYIQARPSLIAAVRRADLLVCSGSDLEIAWLPLLLRKGNNPRVQPGQPGHLMASQFVVRLEIPTTLDRAQGDLHAQGNPHVQTDPHNIGLVARVLAGRLQQVDPANAGRYRQGLAAFEAKWSAAIADWEHRATSLRGARVVLHHKSWAYLTHWLGLVEVATLEPKPGVPPSAAHLNALLEQMRSEPAALIIRAAYQDPKASAWLSARTGIPNAALPFTVGGSAQAQDLFGLFESTIDILLEKTGGDGA